MKLIRKHTVAAALAFAAVAVASAPAFAAQGQGHAKQHQQVQPQGYSAYDYVAPSANPAPTFPAPSGWKDLH
jgi:hypothetical protein